tara:strand:+ start:147 stop:425 length:279 start_codon:yes stop_codon:yes gene_type:complete
MPSMDFAYDLIEKLSEESDTDYAIVILRKGRKQDKLDFFYRFEKENKDTLRVLTEKLELILLEDGDSKGEQKSEPPTPPKKKKRGRPRKKKD